jgi:hypothetical protein
MKYFKYFAYGSNMLTERLKRRVHDVRCFGIARVVGRRLVFHKRSVDKSGNESGKCDIPTTGNNSDVVYGVLFEIPDSQRSALDCWEGHGYEAASILLLDSDSSPVSARAYLATADAIDPRLVPYDWYQCLVVVGARQHRLPGDYISSIVAVRSIPDPKPKRPTRLEALQALKDANVAYTGNA